MRTITVIARNRPVYTSQALRGIALSLAELEPGTYDKLIVCIDPEAGGVNKDVEAVCDKTLEIISESGLIDCELYVNTVTMGVGGNHLVAMQRAFEEHCSDFNVVIEDDAVVTGDALGLALWFHEMYGHQTSEYILFSLCNHADFKKGGNPAHMLPSRYITSPFAFAFTKYNWPFIKSTWNKKEIPPNGWDWSLSFAMWLCKKKAMHPALSRCKNIGRENGVHETPSSFDASQVDIDYSDGTYDGNYELVNPVEVPHRETGLDGWMSSEIRRIFPR